MIFRNDKPVFFWGFALVYLSFVAAMTWVLVRDGPPPGHSMPFLAAVMAVFWLAALGLVRWVSGMRRLRVEVEPEGALAVTWWSPFRKTTRRVAAAEIADCRVAEERDSEGDPYYYCRVELRDGIALDLAESHGREVCESALRRFERGALRKH